MASDDGSLAKQLAELAARLDAVEQRLAAMEAGREDWAFDAAAQETEVLRTPSGRPLVAMGTVPLFGRTVLVLGGAFLVRALTEGDLLPPPAGAMLGLVYAIVWLGFALRASARDVRDATVHGLATALIAFPLLWETTLSFSILPPIASAVALLLVAAFGIAVGWRGRLRALAWLVAGGAAVTAVALGFATGELLAFLWCLLGVGLGVLWLGYHQRTAALALAVGALIYGVLLLLVVVTLARPNAAVLRGVSGPELACLLAALVVGHYGTTMSRTLVRAQELVASEVAGLIATFLVGIVGCVAVSLASALPRPAVAATLLVLGIVFYASAFARVEPRQGRGLTFHVYASGALVLTAMSLPLLIARAPAAILLVSAGTAANALGARLIRPTLSLHGVVYVLVGAMTAGLLASVVDGLLGAAGSLGAWSSPAVLVALVGSAVCSLVRPSVRNPRAAVARGLLTLLLVLSIAALVCTVGAGFLPAGDGRPAALATLRTGVLAVLAVILVGLGRARWADLRWVALAVFVVGGLKLLFEDLRVGHAASLFASMALYGVALLIVSRRSS